MYAQKCKRSILKTLCNAKICGENSIAGINPPIRWNPPWTQVCCDFTESSRKMVRRVADVPPNYSHSDHRKCNARHSCRDRKASRRSSRLRHLTFSAAHSATSAVEDFESLEQSKPSRSSRREKEL